MGDDIIAPIAAALEATPDNLPLRSHLAQLLLDAGRAAEALEHARHVVAREPDHVPALELLVRAARLADEPELAERFGRVLTALTGQPDPLDDGGSEQGPTRLFAISRDDPPPPGEAAPDDPPATVDAERTGAEVVRLRVVEGGGGDDDQFERPTVTLRDVAGARQAKERLELAFLGPLKNPELRSMYGKSLRGGLLLYGPPGCGKTFLARATAGELGAAFFSVGISDVLDMYLGESERKLHELFDHARRHAPCVLFLDEVDALGHKRSQLRGSAGRTLVNQLLEELDHVSTSNEGLFVLAATNHPWDVDSALRRPGRLDRTVLVPPPDVDARHAILQASFSDRPLEKLDLAWLARKTDRFSGADLAHLCESAAELAIAEAIRSGTARPIRMGDVKAALKKLKPSTSVWVQTARNYAMYANEGGAYDELLDWLRGR